MKFSPQIVWQGFELLVFFFFCSFRKVCNNLEALLQVKVVHDLCAKVGGELEALIDMCSKRKSLEVTSSMFKGLPAKKTWNTLL